MCYLLESEEILLIFSELGDRGGRASIWLSSATFPQCVLTCIGVKERLKVVGGEVMEGEWRIKSVNRKGMSIENFSTVTELLVRF